MVEKLSVLGLDVIVGSVVADLKYLTSEEIPCPSRAREPLSQNSFWVGCSTPASLPPWCENQREESLRLRAQTDPHSPGKFRVIGVLQNMPEFRGAFSCKPGQAMVRENACRVW